MSSTPLYVKNAESRLGGRGRDSSNRERLAGTSQIESTGTLHPVHSFPEVHKNLLPYSRIDFTFPCTVLIGGNGTNKTSVLRALQGAPDQCNIGQYWFSTDLDEIKDTKEQRSCFIYGYEIPCGDNPIAEVLKTRIQKEKDPDYWEPSRPIKKHGMETQLPKDERYSPHLSKTRWNAVKKNVVYIDFRENLCAYDKYFYFGTFTSTKTLKSKQDRIRSWSKHLKVVAEERKETYALGRGRGGSRERVVKNAFLEENAVKTISDILGREYDSIQMITHTFYDSKEGTTVLLREPGGSYSEAFAGSGESAVAMTVAKIHCAPPNSLILLDEPETSLHPAAQTELQNYLIDEIRRKHHQVVISTHSPAFAEKLPPDAIKVLSLDRHGNTLVRNEALYQEAFHVVGAPNVEKKIIYVEDRLAKALLEHVMEQRCPDLSDVVEIQHLPGGAEQIIKTSFVANAISDRTNVFYVLDGDKQSVDVFPPPSDLPQSEYEDSTAKFLGIAVNHLNLPFDSGNARDRDAQRQDFLLAILFYLHKGHMLYLPERSTPEALILKYSGAPDDYMDGNSKTIMLNIAQEKYNKKNPDSNEIFYCAKILMGSIPDDCSMFGEIETILREIGGTPQRC